MASAYVYEQKTVTHELTQGIQMAKQLRVNLNSPEAREFLIQKILCSYENALFVLKSGDYAQQPQASALPVASVPESSISIGSPQSGVFEFDQFVQPFIYQQGQNVISKKRKGSTTWEDAVRMCINNGFDGNTDDSYSWRKHGQKDILGTKFPRKQVQGTNANPTDLSATVPSSFSFPLTPFGFMEDHLQNYFPNNFDDELLQEYTPPFISPNTSKSNDFSEWGSSPSLDSADDQADVDLKFKLSDSFIKRLHS